VAGQECTGSVVGTVRERKRAATIVGVTANARTKHGGKQTMVTVTVGRASFTDSALVLLKSRRETDRGAHP